MTIRFAVQFLGSSEFSPIRWRHSRVRDDNDKGMPKIADAGGKEFGVVRRDGDVIITFDGQPTHHVVGKIKESATWLISLVGPRAGVSAVGINTTILSHQGGLGKSPILKEDLSCRQGGYSDGTTVYEVQLPDRNLTWLAERFSCGSGGCLYGYVLFYNPSDRVRFGCSQH